MLPERCRAGHWSKSAIACSTRRFLTAIQSEEALDRREILVIGPTLIAGVTVELGLHDDAEQIGTDVFGELHVRLFQHVGCRREWVSEFDRDGSVDTTGVSRFFTTVSS